MSGVTITMRGDKALQRALSKLNKEAQTEAGKAVDATALEVRGDIIKGYANGPASGVVYKRRTITHQASAPGEAPMSDTGRLANSVVYDKQGPLTADVHTEVEYGAWLEFGTRNIDPRPLWVPVATAALPKFIRRIEAYLRKATR